MYKTCALSFVIITLSICIQSSFALECYVCDRQEENNGKCTTTIKTCEYGEDVCLSEVAWGSTPYWQQGALKQYYVSKRCSTLNHCESYRSQNMGLCTHIWYQDWKCSECCKGDRCNYYIISDSSKPRFMIGLIFSTAIFSILHKFLFV